MSLAVLRRPPAVILVLLGIGPVALSWALVARTLADVRPVTAPRAESIVWADRVFPDRSSLERWLRSRGASYDLWAVRHPGDAAVLEQSRTAVFRSAPQRIDPGALTDLDRSPAAGVSGGSTSAGLARHLVLAALLLVAGVLALGAALPPPVRRWFPSLTARAWPHRSLLAAAATAIVIGLAVGASMS